jgi:AGZA family xanthine/uracil permease-like MFS transporter
LLKINDKGKLPMNKTRNFIYKHFRLKEYNSSVRKEFIAAATNYFTIIYILLLVPEILMGVFDGAFDANGNFVGSAVVFNDMTADSVLAAITAVGFVMAGVASILMGYIINVPFIQGPSIAITTFAAYTVCKGLGYSYGQMLALVFLSGICFFVLSITGIEYKIHKAVPINLKYAVTAGIGFFVAFSGLRKAHIIDYDPDNLLKLFDVTDISSYNTISAYLALCGVIVITVMLKKHIHGAVFIGKLLCIAAAIPLGLVHLPENGFADVGIPVGRLMFNIKFDGLLDFSGAKPFAMSLASVLVVVLSICMMDIFETMGMLIAVDTLTDINKEEKPIKRRIPQILELDAVTTGLGAVMGSASVSTYAESTTGIIEGGRTGLTAVFTGLMFLVSVVISPLMTAIPSAATATTLIVAGILMMGVIKYIDFENISEAVPAFMTMFLMPLTGSMLIGVAVGITLYVLIHLLCGETKKPDLFLYVLTLFFAAAVIFTSI